MKNHDSEFYSARKNNQHAGLFKRLSQRSVTARKLALYAGLFILLILAEPWPLTFVLGTVLVASGLLLRLWTFGHLEKNQTLITTGPYAYSRNPAYLGSALIATGIVIAAGNPESNAGIAIWLVGPVGLALFFSAYMKRKYHKEYGRLKKLFPGDYERHAAHVPHFLPRLTPWTSGCPRRFSWTLVKVNHELAWSVLCLAALGAMWLG